MTDSTLERKLEDARRVRTTWQSETIFIGSAVIVLLFLVGIPVFEGEGPFSQLGYVMNAFTELLSIGLTALVLNRLAERREQVRQRNEDLHRIIREMRSKDGNEGRRAAEEARERGFLTDRSLNGANLWRANLSGADLRHSDLSGVDLGHANLSDAELYRTNLSGAILRHVDLSWTDMWDADLRGAKLNYAILNEAELHGANLSRAVLRQADLSGAQLDTTIFSRETVMPDAQRVSKDENGNPVYDKYWTPDADMSRYTNPNHPDFWQPTWVQMGFENAQEWQDAGEPQPDDTSNDDNEA